MSVFDNYYNLLRYASENQLTGVRDNNFDSLQRALEFGENAKQIANNPREKALAIGICSSIEHVMNVTNCHDRAS